ncbi:MAG: alpha/beta hydrolase family protein [Stellaceae bacterium]
MTLAQKLALSVLLLPLCAVGMAAVAPAQQASPPSLAELRAEVQARADAQAYPIAGIDKNDVRAVLATLTSTNREEWAAAWAKVGDSHAKQAGAAYDPAVARAHWRQAWLDYQFGAWPAPTTDGKCADYGKAVNAFRHYALLLDPPAETVRIPFDGKAIVGLLQLPKSPRPAPVVMSIGGLDEYKEFAIEHDGAFPQAGLGLLALDMPGTGEAPVPMDFGSERMISKAIDYLRTRNDVDPRRIAISGTSAGGYWSALTAYQERSRIRAAVVRGAPIDGYFHASWQRKSWSTNEYLFGLKEARFFVYGFKPEQDRAFLDRLKQFSLKRRGVLAEPSAPMLVVNGAKDTQVPIADLYLLLSTGSPKFAWVNPEGGHTGRSKDFPDARIVSDVVLPWLESMLR